MAEHLNDLVSMLRSTIPSTVNLHVNIAESAKYSSVLADPTQLQQILLNLCNNSVQAMQEKGNLEVGLELVELHQRYLPKGRNLAAGGYACLSVHDDGCGIEPEQLGRIFDPFFTTKEVGKGTGMGLAVVQGIVDSHDGFIVPQSEPGKGSTFSVYFPLSDELPEKSEDPSDGDDRLPCGHERILLVDDEEALLEVSSHLLQEYGYRVTAVNSGHKALALFNQDPFVYDLVITDQTMPDITGQALAADLLKSKPDLPIILCSGYSSIVNEQEARQQGICAYLQKPLNLADLVRQVRSILDSQQED